MTPFNRIEIPGINGVLEIAVLAVAIYYILSLFRGTRGAQVLSGLAILYAALLSLTYFFEFDALHWLLQRFTVYLSVALLIIFQPEIRRALAELGPRHLLTNGSGERTVVETLMTAVQRLTENKIGALIAIERGVSMAPYQEAGTTLDSRVTPELIVSLFFPNSPLHDGGVIIRGDRLLAAGCLFPLSQRPELSRALGTRHRAAIGLSEESDAIVIVVSEETGAVSAAYKGRLRRGIDSDVLERFLSKQLLGGRRSSSVSSSRIRRWLDWARGRPRVAAHAIKGDVHGAG
ncbi:MAG: diadenylate cyclase CdaA [Kiritimatiellae bacterium]|nr:diadenylate cyclase CdaA [Kiritimatiellia bacterium]